MLTEGTTAIMGPDAIADRGGSTPLGRAGTVEEIAAVVAFVASPAAGYVTGATFHTDGGRQAI